MQWGHREAADTFKAKRHDKQWAETMGWLVGGGGWEDGRCKALEAVLDLVCRAAKCE